MINGGFDPIAVLAEVDDTLLIVTSDREGHLHPGFSVVSRLRPPSVVRTVPAAQRTDVPLNTGVLIVFTEPMDSASILNGITLQLDGVVVPSTISFSLIGGGAIQVAVQPLAALDPGKTYEIVIASSVQDLLGQSLAAPVLIPFTTTVVTTGGSTDLTVTSFTMIDFHDTFLVPFEYAPQLLVTNTGSSSVHVFQFKLLRMASIDTNSTQPVCIAGINVGPGQTVQVFQLVDGKYPVAFTPHLRAAGSVLVSLRYRRDGDVAREISFEGSIIPGGSFSSGGNGVGVSYQPCLS